MTKPTSKKLRVAGALTLAAGILGARSAPLTAGTSSTRTLGAASATRVVAGVGVVPHDDGGDGGGDGGDSGDSGDDTGNERGMTP